MAEAPAALTPIEVTTGSLFSFSLVGMPGCGKSTVGRQLAKQLGVRFIDLDAELERQLGEAIRPFFEREGEAAFRDIEHQALSGLLKQPSEMVLATGGGAVLREANRALLAERSTVVYLRSSPEELFRRLRHDTQRPLLQVNNPLGKLRELYQQRDPLYRRTAHYLIETGRPSVSSLVNMILMQLELAGLVDSARVPSSVLPRLDSSS
jgi:shikimate kinase